MYGQNLSDKFKQQLGTFAFLGLGLARMGLRGGRR